MKKVTYVWKIKLSRPWTFDNDSCRLRIISHLWRSNSKAFVDVWLSLDKSIAEFPILYKKMSALVWNRVYNHDFGLLPVQLYKFCLEYSGCAFHFLFHAHVLWYANQLRNGMKCACASADCVPLKRILLSFLLACSFVFWKLVMKWMDVAIKSADWLKSS